MEILAGLWVAAVAVAVVPLLLWWNDYWYALPFRLCRGVGGRGSKLPLPPGYMGIPFLGEMLSFLWFFKVTGRPDDFINAKRHKYGDGVGLYRTHLFGKPTIIACTPSANKFVLQSNLSFVMKWHAPELVGKTSIAVVDGDAHSRLRGLVLRAITQPDALRKITLMVQPRIEASLKSWAKSGRITAFNVAKKLIFANSGKYFASIEKDHILDSLDEFLIGVVNGVRAYPLNIPGTSFHYGLQCRRKAMAILREELEKRKNCKYSSPRNDLMESLMQMKDEDDNQLTDDEVLDNIVTLMVGGYFSTSLALTWGLYYLAKYPDVLQKLREENMAVSKKLKGGLVTYEEIASCKYTSKVVEEVIRLSNITPFVFRTATKDVDYRGYKIPKGWRVACWFRYMHTNPEHYEDPACFNPDRWNEAATPGSYSVFGGGTRICAGNMFARLNLSILLHHLAVGYRWNVVNPDAEVCYLPHPIPVDGVEIDFHAI